jgi:hypothetical protein
MRVRRVGTSDRSECTRALEMPGAYLPVSHTAPGDGGTDSAMRTYVPRPTAIAPARYHVPYCALRAGAGCGGRAKPGGCAPRRRPAPLAYNQGDSAADHGPWSGGMASSKGKAWDES